MLSELYMTFKLKIFQYGQCFKLKSEVITLTLCWKLDFLTSFDYIFVIRKNQSMWREVGRKKKDLVLET